MAVGAPPPAMRGLERIALATLALAGAGAIWTLTRVGIGVGNDSVVYLAGAQNIARGEGFVWFSGDHEPRPINHYPPIYSTALASFLRLSVPRLEAARFMNSILLGANTILVGLLAHRLTQLPGAAIATSAVFLVSEEVWDLHAWAMSDPLYLFWVLLAVWIVAADPGGRRSLFRLAAAGVAAGLAGLTRYAGWALVVGVGAFLTAKCLIRRPHGWKELGAFALPAVLPGVAWLIRNQALTGSATNRQAGWFPQSAAWWRNVVDVSVAWFLPGRVAHWLSMNPLALGALVLVAGGVGVWFLGRRKAELLAMSGPLAAGVLVATVTAAHLAGTIAAAWTSYPDPDINSRILAPVYAGGLLLVMGCVCGRVGGGGRIARWAAGLALTALFAFKLYSVQDSWRRLSSDGQGYTSRTWQNSKTVRALRGIQAGVIYTDNLGAVFFFTDHYAFSLPLRYESRTGVVREDYMANLRVMVDRLDREGGVVVVFHRAARVPEYPDLEDLAGELTLCAEYVDGAILGPLRPPPGFRCPPPEAQRMNDGVDVLQLDRSWAS